MSFHNVSLLTGNLQPKGHPFYVDQKTVDGAARLLAEKPLAAHLSHEGAGKERLGSAIGFFKGIYADGLNLRAKTFEFLDSFKSNFKAQYDNLAELAQKFPEQFGVSLHLKYQPVWVLRDGSEIPAKVVDGRLAELAPADAVRPLPSARVTAVPSGDFVTSPAANLSGLLSGLLAEIDTNPIINMSAPVTFDQAALDSKLAEQKQAITAELTAKVTTVEAQLAEAVKARAELDATLATLTAAKDEAVAALAARDSVIVATLSEAGVKVEKFEPAALKAALSTRIESEAQTLLAARGMKPLPEQLKSPELEAKLETDAQVEEAYLALKPGTAESIAFVEKHREALWRINSAKPRR